jgi:hypothetical protein
MSLERGLQPTGPWLVNAVMAQEDIVFFFFVGHLARLRNAPKTDNRGKKEG